MAEADGYSHQNSPTSTKALDTAMATTDSVSLNAQEQNKQSVDDNVSVMSNDSEAEEDLDEEGAQWRRYHELVGETDELWCKADDLRKDMESFREIMDEFLWRVYYIPFDTTTGFLDCSSTSELSLLINHLEYHAETHRDWVVPWYQKYMDLEERMQPIKKKIELCLEKTVEFDDLGECVPSLRKYPKEDEEFREEVRKHLRELREISMDPMYWVS